MKFWIYNSTPYLRSEFVYKPHLKIVNRRKGWQLQKRTTKNDHFEKRTCSPSSESRACSVWATAVSTTYRTDDRCSPRTDSEMPSRWCVGRHRRVLVCPAADTITKRSDKLTTHMWANLRNAVDWHPLLEFALAHQRIRHVLLLSLCTTTRESCILAVIVEAEVLALYVSTSQKFGTQRMRTCKQISPSPAKMLKFKMVPLKMRKCLVSTPGNGSNANEKVGAEFNSQNSRSKAIVEHACHQSLRRSNSHERKVFQTCQYTIHKNQRLGVQRIFKHSQWSYFRWSLNLSVRFIVAHETRKISPRHRKHIKYVPLCTRTALSTSKTSVFKEKVRATRLTAAFLAITITR